MDLLLVGLGTCLAGLLLSMLSETSASLFERAAARTRVCLRACITIPFDFVLTRAVVGGESPMRIPVGPLLPPDTHPLSIPLRFRPYEERKVPDSTPHGYQTCTSSTLTFVRI